MRGSRKQIFFGMYKTLHRLNESNEDYARKKAVLRKLEKEQTRCNGKEAHATTCEMMEAEPHRPQVKRFSSLEKTWHGEGEEAQEKEDGESPGFIFCSCFIRFGFLDFSRL